jgi:hypothetical protein
MLIQSAYGKMCTPLPVLHENWPWTENIWLLLGSSFIDVAGAVAIVIPAALDR